jgi:putative ABC transport system permease protein
LREPPARTSGRRRELALRAALGAGRGRIVRQLLSESLLLSALGGVVGLALGAGILAAAPSIVPAGLLPSTVTPAFDLRVAAFCVMVVLAVAVLFGLAPAWQATTLTPGRGLDSGDRTTPGVGGRLRTLLVAGEVATAVLLLFGAGLLLRTLIAIETTERGYRPESVLTMMVDPLDSEYPTPTALLGFLDAIEREVEAAPGVRAVGWTSTLPMGDSMTGDVTFEVIGAPLLAAAERPVAEYHVANPSYFDTVDVPLVEGRLFTVFDTIDAAPLALVNETFARRYLPGRSPVGARLILRGANAPPDVVPTIREVVGVVGDVRRRPDQTEAAPQIYAPMSQTPQGDVYLVVRADAGPADALTGAIRAAIATVDRAQLVSVRDIETLDAVAGAATGRYRFRATLVMTFAGLALLLAMVGVFGILAYSVQQQSGDFAVRRALGATARDVVRLVVTSVAKVVVVGTIVGLLLAAALGRLLTAVLFGVEPLDATTFVAVVALLGIAAAASVAAPAWRAARIDPATALRNQ